MTSDTLPINVVSDYADNIVAQQISRMDGVGQVNLGGPRKPAIRIQIDPRKAAALGLQLDQIRASIAQGTVNAPKGQLVGAQQALTIYADDQALDAKTWNDLIVGYKNGGAIRVSDLGGAILSVENNQGGAWSEVGKAGKYDTLQSGPAIHVVVFKQPGANVIQTVDGVKAALPLLRAAVPPGINMNIVADRTLTIRASVREVKMTLLITIVLVVVVIFLFLRNVMATAIPSAVIPVSLFATAAVMLPAHFTLDNLSLMALTIAVGFVVDDAIVMVEGHLAPHRAWPAAVRGCPGRIARDRLYHPDNLHFPDRGVHTRDVHGRGDRHHHARVCPDAERSGVRLSDPVTDIDPDALQSLPESAKTADLEDHEGVGGRLPRARDQVCQRLGSGAAA